MTHPGFIDEILNIKSSYNFGRKTELDIQSTEEARKSVRELRIELITFKILKKSE